MTEALDMLDTIDSLSQAGHMARAIELAVRGSRLDVEEKSAITTLCDALETRLKYVEQEVYDAYRAPKTGADDAKPEGAP